jgi:1A family penicillin-binding protein
MSKKRFRISKKELLMLIFAIGIFFVGVVVIWISTFKIPTLDSFEQRRVSESTKIYDRTGEIVLYDVNQDTKRTVVPYEEISRNIKNATVAIEDQEFYQHKGIKPRSILRAILINTSSLEFSQGGSTITQQVVKNSLLSQEKTISRKLKEWVLALKLEKILSKDEILNLYLNENPYGGSIYGVEEATEAFFGKKASDVTIAEAAYLASLPQAPTYYSPYGNHKDRLEERKNLVLKEMLQNGFITEEEYNSALEEKVLFKPRPETGIKAPHFVFYVIDYLKEKYGEEEIQNGGLRVITTLDYEMQSRGESIANEYALKNENTFNAENAAFIAIDPKTGQILVMVGSRNYFDEDIDGAYNAAASLPGRQPGSTFKPFVYSEAFLKGYTPDTVLFDLRTQFAANCRPDNFTSDNNCYSPENYDQAFRGPLTMRNSLAQSVNITSVKTLYLAGIQDSIRLARRMGITTLEDSGRYGLTLVLGGGEVTLLDMTSAYGVFANEGKRNPYTAILEVKDRDGNVLESFKPKTTDALDRSVALQISEILSDNDARAPAFGQTSYLYIPDRDVAVKTGTTDDYRDAWILGYTPSVVLGAWAGNNNNSPMEKKVAGFIVAPMWRDLMDKILQKYPIEYFPAASREDSFDLKPVLRGKWQGGISHLVDSVSKKLATEYTPQELINETLTGGVHSILHWVDKNNPRGAIPPNPEQDSQYDLWEYPVRSWAAQRGIVPTDESSLPTTYDDVHDPANSPMVTINTPVRNSVFEATQKITVTTQSQGKYPTSRVDYFVDNTFVGNVKNYPFVFSFIPTDVSVPSGLHTLKVVIYDSILNKGETEIEFSVK